VAQDYEWYVPVEREGTSGERATDVHFMIRALLASRVDTGMSSEDAPNEEAVNIYLAYLLRDVASPQYHERVQAYISAFDSSVFERVRQSTDTRLKYTVYKANADHILLMMGLFQNPRGQRPVALPEELRIDDGVHLGRGKAYYDFAFTYGSSLFGRSSGIAAVLGTLSEGFPRYVKLLEHMRGQYFNLIARISEGEMFHLQRSVAAGDLPALRDQFLDAYADWRREPTAERRALLLETAARIEAIDPEFHFQLPEN